jgi:hypothetical protein
MPYYKNNTTVLSGGGVQSFSRELKNIVEYIPKSSTHGLN